MTHAYAVGLAVMRRDGTGRGVVVAQVRLRGAPAYILCAPTGLSTTVPEAILRVDPHPP